MTQNEIIEMAREAASHGVEEHPSGEVTYVFYNEHLMNFAKLVAAKEREACAKVCEDIEVEETHYCMNVYEEGTRYKFAVIEAIRARGEA